MPQPLVTLPLGTGPLGLSVRPHASVTVGNVNAADVANDSQLTVEPVGSDETEMALLGEIV